MKATKIKYIEAKQSWEDYYGNSHTPLIKIAYYKEGRKDTLKNEYHTAIYIRMAEKMDWRLAECKYGDHFEEYCEKANFYTDIDLTKRFLGL